MLEKPLSLPRYWEKPEITRSELNVQKWTCLFATSRSREKSRELVRRSGDREIKLVIGKQSSGGKEIEVGVLKIPSYKVLVALIHIWESRGKPLDWVVSSLYELSEVMGRRWGGGAGAQALKAALKDLRDIPIQWIGFFYKPEDRYIAILEDQPLRFIKVKFFTAKRGDREIESRFAFKFDERILENLLLGYTKPVRLDVISKLSEIATLLYCHVDVVMADKNTYTRKSKDLFQDLGLTSKRYRYLSRRREALEQAIEELIDEPRERGERGTPLSTGILTSIALSETKDHKDINVRFTKEPFRKASPRKSAEEIKELVSEMERVLGVGERNRGFYVKLARSCPTDLIRMALKDTMEEERAGRITGSKAQFFGYWIQYLAAKRGIDLGLKTSFGDLLEEL